MQQTLKDNRRLIAFAPIMRDFRAGYVQVSSIKALLKALQKRWETGFRIAYRPSEGDEIAELHRVALLLKGAQAPYAHDRDNRQITLAVDEINLSFPHSRPAGIDGFKWAILQGRHWGINIVAATQRPQLVHPDLRDNADTWIVFALGGDQALSAVLAAHGRAHAEPLRALPNYHFIAFSDGAARPGQTSVPKKKSP